MPANISETRTMTSVMIEGPLEIGGFAGNGTVLGDALKESSWIGNIVSLLGIPGQVTSEFGCPNAQYSHTFVVGLYQRGAVHVSVSVVLVDIFAGGGMFTVLQSCTH